MGPDQNSRFKFRFRQDSIKYCQFFNIDTVHSPMNLLLLATQCILCTNITQILHKYCKTAHTEHTGAIEQQTRGVGNTRFSRSWRLCSNIELIKHFGIKIKDYHGVKKLAKF